MTEEKKDSRDEKLIEELYEKLWWYTYEADDEEFDEKEVDAIVRLLDVLEPVGEDRGFKPGADAALDRFWKRYGEEEKSDDDKKVISPKPKEKKRKKIFVRMAIGVAACAVLLVSVNVGSYALRNKSFFEIVREEVGRTEITVTGNTEGFEENDDNSIECSSWSEAEKILGEDVLKPTEMPDGYELNSIVIQSMEPGKIIIAKYSNNLGDYFRFSIDIYRGEYKKDFVQYDRSWILVGEDETGYKAQYYQKEEMIEACFFYGKSIYYVLSSEDIEIVRYVITNMK